MLGVADPIKPSTPAALQALRAEGLRVIMLTGDARATAEAVARGLGIEEVRRRGAAGRRRRPRCGRCGTRVTRSRWRATASTTRPRWRAADVGIAMGTGTDVAIESAGITLVKGDLRGVVRARRLSRRPRCANIRQNLFFAFVYNALGVPVAAGVLYPWTGWLLSPMLASAAMRLSSVSVIANALRLRRVRL